MNENAFYALSKSDKAAIFNAVAAQTGMTPFAVEKDWWVSRTLAIVFTLSCADFLVFKGGTSLSKVWQLIHRFSEDVDLAIDRAYFGFTGQMGKNQRDKFRKQAGAFIDQEFSQNLRDAFNLAGFNMVEIAVEPVSASDLDRKINIYYPNIIPAPGYLTPKIQLEISSRSLREPFTFKEIGSLVDTHFPDKAFAMPLFVVPTVDPERTFLEKLFLLHEEFHRPVEKMRVERLSRHMYDIFQLHKAGIAGQAIANKPLYENIVAHRYQFARIGGVDYRLHHPHLLNPIPVHAKVAAWKADYSKMREEMIYEAGSPSFEELVQCLETIKTQLHAVKWNFDLRF